MSYYTPQCQTYEVNLNRGLFVCFLCILLKDIFNAYSNDPLSEDQDIYYYFAIYIILCLTHFTCIITDVYEHSIKTLVVYAITYVVFNDSIVFNKIKLLFPMEEYLISIISVIVLIVGHLIADILSINNLYIVKAIGMNEILSEFLPHLLVYFTLSLLFVNMVEYYKYSKLTILLSKSILTLLIVLVVIIKVSQERIKSIFPSYIPIFVILSMTFLYTILEIREVMVIQKQELPIAILFNNDMSKLKQTILACVINGIINGSLEIEVVPRVVINEKFQYKEDTMNKKIIMSDINFRSLLNTLKFLGIYTKVSKDDKPKTLEGEGNQKLLVVYSHTIKISHDFREIDKDQMTYIFGSSDRIDEAIDTLNEYFKRNNDYYNFLKVGGLYLSDLICNSISYTSDLLDTRLVFIGTILMVVALTWGVYLIIKELMITVCFLGISLVINMLNYEKALFLNKNNCYRNDVFLISERIRDLNDPNINALTKRSEQEVADQIEMLKKEEGRNIELLREILISKEDDLIKCNTPRRQKRLQEQIDQIKEIVKLPQQRAKNKKIIQFFREVCEQYKLSKSGKNTQDTSKFKSDISSLFKEEVDSDSSSENGPNVELHRKTQEQIKQETEIRQRMIEEQRKAEEEKRLAAELESKKRILEEARKLKELKEKAEREAERKRLKAEKEQQEEEERKRLEYAKSHQEEVEQELKAAQEKLLEAGRKLREEQQKKSEEEMKLKEERKKLEEERIKQQKKTEEEAAEEGEVAAKKLKQQEDLRKYNKEQKKLLDGVNTNHAHPNDKNKNQNKNTKNNNNGGKEQNKTNGRGSESNQNTRNKGTGNATKGKGKEKNK